MMAEITARPAKITGMIIYRLILKGFLIEKCNNLIML
jgi:hypothetical protein